MIFVTGIIASAFWAHNEEVFAAGCPQEARGKQFPGLCKIVGLQQLGIAHDVDDLLALLVV